MNLTAHAAPILAELKDRREEMVALLARMARLESPSREPASQGPVFDLLAGELDRLGYRCRRLAGRDSGGQLLAIPRRDGSGGPWQLLLGHGDTVWPQGTLETMPVERRDGRLHGPGVYDMKAGLVQALFALETLQRLKLKPPVTPIVFINSDEEIGSGESAHQVRRLARVADRAFVMEPSLGVTGKLKTSRKGVGRFVVEIRGRSAHAGLDPDKGVSAILELSHVIQALFALNEPGHGTTVNVGTIDGGLQPNVIAAAARAEVDVRVATQADAGRVERAIRSLRPTVAGTQLHITGQINRPPLEPTPRNRYLWKRAAAAADALGLEIEEGAAGGGSDGNFASQHTATLDGLGAVGDGAHATHEHVVEARMPERAALLACLLLGEPLDGNGFIDAVDEGTG